RDLTSKGTARTAGEVFYESAYRKLVTADLRDMLVLLLKDYRRSVDPEGMPILVQLFLTVFGHSNVSATHMNLSPAEPLPHASVNPAGGNGPPGRDALGTTVLGREAKPSKLWNFYSYLVFSAGSAQCERLLGPLRSWQSKSSRDSNLFEEMLSVQKFMEEFADAIKSLKEEIFCDEKYYSMAWDTVFAPSDPNAKKQLASKYQKYSVHLVVDALRQHVRDALFWVAGEKKVTGVSNFQPQHGGPRRRPWNMASEEELPPSGGK
ncbi:unnamed protein product, partial [Amoebophrya sp. A25]